MSAEGRYRINLDTARAAEKITLSGNELRIVGYSSADALMQVRLAKADGSNTGFYDFYKGCYFVERQGFFSIYIKNDAQAGEWLELEATEGDGDFEYHTPDTSDIQSVRDTVNVQTKAGETVAVSNSAFAELVTIDNNTQRTSDVMRETGLSATYMNIAAKTDLNGASFASANNTTNTIVTSGANTSGVVLRIGLIEKGAGSTLSAQITVGGNPVLVSSPDGSDTTHIKDLFIPAGKAVELVSYHTSQTVYAWYEVL